MKCNCLVLTLLFFTAICFSQNPADYTPNMSKENKKFRVHSVGINPIKPFIGLPNAQYEFQPIKHLGITAFTEYLAYNVIPNFEHPHMVSKVGLSFYPFLQGQEINGNFYLNANFGYVMYNAHPTKNSSFTNGLELGFKFLSKNYFFAQPKILINYNYSSSEILPGFEVLIGYIFKSKNAHL